MTAKRKTPGSNGDTMNAPSVDDQCIAAARAQAELIDTLARLVLACVERENSRVGETTYPPIGPAAQCPKTARGSRGAGAT